MEEKRKDLKNTKQKAIINDVITALNETHPSFYYLSTIEVAGEIEKYIQQPGNLSHDQLEDVKGLTRRDIQILLSLHDR